MPTNINQLPPNIVQLVTNAVAAQNANNPNSYQLDPNTVLGVVATESSGNVNAINYNYNVTGDPSSGVKSIDYGLMQLNSKSHPDAGPTMDPATNVKIGVNQLWQGLQNNGGNENGMLENYNGEKPPPYTYADKVNAAASNTANTPGSDVLTGTEEGSIFLSPTASAYHSLNNNAGNVNTAALTPLIVIQEGLDATPWYQDQGLITGNPRLRQQVQPVNFQVLLHDNNYFILSSKGETGNPINVQLNASMKNINWSMKHNYHHQRTRTAHHITMWGMNADTIEGQCTTGVFMNQFGITDYYSTRTVNDDLKNLVTSGTMFNNVPFNQMDEATLIQAQKSVTGEGGVLGGAVSVTQQSGSSSQYQSIMNKRGFNQTSAFRVAAQDAFAEFLALFKMNGNVWFWNQLWNTGTGDTRDWAQIDAWSPVLGLNTTQINARNNDVLTRGGVIMSYRNYTFQGYFKSLQWTMDANTPYLWNFNFVFQVEKTIGAEFYPS